MITDAPMDVACSTLPLTPAARGGGHVPGSWPRRRGDQHDSPTMAASRQALAGLHASAWLQPARCNTPGSRPAQAEARAARNPDDLARRLAVPTPPSRACPGMRRTGREKRQLPCTLTGNRGARRPRSPRQDEQEKHYLFLVVSTVLASLSVIIIARVLRYILIPLRIMLYLGYNNPVDFP